MAYVILLITALTFVVSLIGFVTGFGVGTYMAPLVMFGIPYKQALFFVAIVHWMNSVWKSGFFLTSVNMPLVIYFGIPALIASFLGALLVLAEPSGVLSHVLGAFLIGYALFLLCKPTFCVPATRLFACFGGFLSGFLAGLFGVRGALKGSFLASFDLQAREYLATMGVISLLIDTTRMVTYWLGGITLSPMLHWALVWSIPVSYLAAWLGNKIVAYIPQNQFKSFIAVSLLVAGVWILVVMNGSMEQ